MFRTALTAIHESEEGHAAPAAGSMLAGVGAIVLAIGAVNDNGAAAIIGGIVLALGIVAGAVLHHLQVDYELFRRTDKL